MYVVLLLILGLNAVSEDAYNLTQDAAQHFGGGLSDVSIASIEKKTDTFYQKHESTMLHVLPLCRQEI